MYTVDWNQPIKISGRAWIASSSWSVGRCDSIWFEQTDAASGGCHVDSSAPLEVYIRSFCSASNRTKPTRAAKAMLVGHRCQVLWFSATAFTAGNEPRSTSCLASWDDSPPRLAPFGTCSGSISLGDAGLVTWPHHLPSSPRPSPWSVPRPGLREWCHHLQQVRSACPVQTRSWDASRRPASAHQTSPSSASPNQNRMSVAFLEHHRSRFASPGRRRTAMCRHASPGQTNRTAAAFPVRSRTSDRASRARNRTSDRACLGRSHRTGRIGHASPGQSRTPGTCGLGPASLSQNRTSDLASRRCRCPPRSRRRHRRCPRRRTSTPGSDSAAWRQSSGTWRWPTEPPVSSVSATRTSCLAAAYRRENTTPSVHLVQRQTWSLIRPSYRFLKLETLAIYAFMKVPFGATPVHHIVTNRETVIILNFSCGPTKGIWHRIIRLISLDNQFNYFSSIFCALTKEIFAQFN